MHYANAYNLFLKYAYLFLMNLILLLEIVFMFVDD